MVFESGICNYSQKLYTSFLWRIEFFWFSPHKRIKNYFIWTQQISYSSKILTWITLLNPIPSENSNNKLYKLNYVKGISNKIINILKKHNIRTTCINTNNIGKILTNNKDKSDKFSKSGIYCINCNECNAVYYGQTGRNLWIRPQNILNQ